MLREIIDSVLKYLHMLIILIPASVVVLYLLCLRGIYETFGLFCATHPFARKSCEAAKRFLYDEYAPRHHVSLGSDFWLSVGQRIESEYTAPRVDHWSYRQKFKTIDYTLYIVFCTAHKRLCESSTRFCDSEMEALEIASNYLLQRKTIDKSEAESAINDVFSIHSCVRPGVDYWTPAISK